LNEDDRLMPLLYRIVHESSKANEEINATGRVIQPEQIDEVALILMV
jgi:hypothetical protein